MNSRKQYLAELLFTDIEAECILRTPSQEN
jgi:hypothetical protein